VKCSGRAGFVSTDTRLTLDWIGREKSVTPTAAAATASLFFGDVDNQISSIDRLAIHLKSRLGILLSGKGDKCEPT
jgi:hypothetical protein